jgi:DNA-binding transcriptional LysR family regulator
MKVDLNLFTVFDAVLRTRSVTRAAETLGLNQSSTSNALQRLRDTFNDPLFVRSGNQMNPTPLASAMAAPIRNALGEVQHAMETARAFDPAHSDRTFRVSVNDIGQLVFIPKLMAHLRRAAPGISLETVDTGPHQAKHLLAEGTLDLVIGALDDFGAEYHRQALFSDTIVCVVSGRRFRGREKLTLDEYLNGLHGTYRPVAPSHILINRAIEQVFAAHRRERRVALHLAYMTGIGTVIEATDLIFTLPTGLARHIAQVANVRVLPLPFKPPRIEISQEWHHRFHRDAGNQWLRQAVAALFRKADPRELY